MKYFTYESLKAANAVAVRAKRNRSLYFDRLPIEDDGTTYPIVQSYIHNDIEMRCQLILNGQGDSAWLDMDIGDYLDLPDSGHHLPENSSNGVRG